MKETKNSKKQLCLYLTDDEKKELIQKSKSENYPSLNSYIKHKLFLDKEDTDLSSKGFIESDAILDGKAIRTHHIKAVLSEDEYNYLKKIAGNMSISSFIRKTILTANNGKFIFEVKGEDLSDLSLQLSQFNMKIDGFLGALRYRTELYETDILAIKKILNELNDNIKKIIKTTLVDRNYIRKKGIAHLQNQINKII